MTIVEQGSGPTPDLIKETTTQTFVKDVIEESKRQPVLIDFWAPWCGPCRMVAPIVDELAEEYDGKVSFTKLNADENPDTVREYGIRGIPTLILFKGGEEAARIVGFQGKGALKKQIDAALV